MGFGPLWFDLGRRDTGDDENGPTGEAIFDEWARRAARQLDRVSWHALAKALMSNANPAAVIANARLWRWRGAMLAERWRD